jgi:hypothetical protein
MDEDDYKPDVRKLPEDTPRPEWMDRPKDLEPLELIGFDECFRNTISKIVSDVTRNTDHKISDANRAELRNILTEYCYKAEYRLGIPSKGDFDAIRVLANNARDLKLKLDNIDPNIRSTFIESNLSSSQLRQLLDLLQILERIGRGRTDYTDSAPELIGKLAAWWERVSGKYASTYKDIISEQDDDGEMPYEDYDDGRSPFNKFVKATIATLPEDLRPGKSPKAILKRKSQYNVQCKKEDDWHSSIQETFAAWGKKHKDVRIRFQDILKALKPRNRTKS